MIDFSKWKFHPSSLGKIMTDSRTKDPIGETCKKHLLECWLGAVYGRERDIENKYMLKGTLVEDDSITLYSRVKKELFFKNKEVVSNDFLIGTPDLFLGKSIMTADEIIDIKSSWDIYTFHEPLVSAIKKDYLWQLQGYMDITGATSARLVYCLVDTPDPLVWKEKESLKWKMGVIDPSMNQDYQDACDAIDKAMKFSDIPIEKRYLEFTFDRDNSMIAQAHERIELCRKTLNSLPQ